MTFFFIIGRVVVHITFGINRIVTSCVDLILYYHVGKPTLFYFNFFFSSELQLNRRCDHKYKSYFENDNCSNNDVDV